MFSHYFSCVEPWTSSPVPQRKGTLLQDPSPIEPASLRGRAAISSPARSFFLAADAATSYFEPNFWLRRRRQQHRGKHSILQPPTPRCRGHRRHRPIRPQGNGDCETPPPPPSSRTMLTTPWRQRDGIRRRRWRRRDGRQRRRRRWRPWVASMAAATIKLTHSPAGGGMTVGLL